MNVGQPQIHSPCSSQQQFDVVFNNGSQKKAIYIYVPWKLMIQVTFFFPHA